MTCVSVRLQRTQAYLQPKSISQCFFTHHTDRVDSTAAEVDARAAVNAGMGLYAHIYIGLYAHTYIRMYIYIFVYIYYIYVYPF